MESYFRLGRNMDQIKIKDSKEAMLLLEVASNAGTIMLKNGAEIYRVEDTVERILSSVENVSNVDVYSTFNGLILSFNLDGEIKSNIRRVKTRSYNLSKINEVNTFSRKFCNGDYSLIEALKALEEINIEKNLPPIYEVMGVATASAAFTALLFKDKLEILVAFVVGLLAIIFNRKMSKRNWGYFLDSFFVGFFISCFTILFKKFIPIINIDEIIIGAMMPFLTGALLTNSVRDLMSGNTTSGLTAAITAILTSTALAVGVAMPIQIFLL
jgi:uncharacterized membrane protein YjjP (DUF1212 family)